MRSFVFNALKIASPCHTARHVGLSPAFEVMMRKGQMQAVGQQVDSMRLPQTGKRYMNMPVA